MIDGKEGSLCTCGNSSTGLHSRHVCNGKPLDKAVPSSRLRRRLTLINKIVHFPVSILMLNSERMVLLHLKHKILCSWFLSHHSYSNFFIMWLKSQHRIEILTYKNCWNGNYYDEHHIQKYRVGVSVSGLKMTHGKKNTIKSFERENKFYSYLTRETLPAEERISKFRNHGNTPSYQTLADATWSRNRNNDYRYNE